MILTNESNELSLTSLEESLYAIQEGTSDLILDEATIADVKSLLTERTGAALEQVAVNFLAAPKKLLSSFPEAYELFQKRTENFKVKIKDRIEKDIAFFRRKEVLSEESGSEVKDTAVLSKIKDYIKAVYEEMEYTIKYDKYTLEGFGYAAMSVYLIILVNSLFASVLTGLFMAIFGLSLMSASLAGILVCAVFVAPFTEEYAKKHSIENGYAQEFILTFNIAEFSMYVARFGASFGILLLRSIAVVMHYVTFTIQRRRLSKGDVHGTFLDVSTKNSKVDERNFKAAMITHGVYNAFGGIVIEGLRQVLNIVVRALT